MGGVSVESPALRTGTSTQAWDYGDATAGDGWTSSSISRSEQQDLSEAAIRNCSVAAAFLPAEEPHGDRH